jgi:MYXO-CTERM domain-containing protein
MRFALLGLVFGVAFSYAGAALAHGSFPEGRQLLTDPTKPERFWLRTTYGVLKSEDHGATWSWICYEAPGFVPTEEPVFGVTQNGTLLAALFDGLSRTNDGCGWSPVSAELQKTTTGLAIDPGNPSHVWALVSRGDGQGGFENQLWKSTNAGDSFTLVGAPYDTDGLLLSLAVAPSDPTRMYIAGLFATTFGNNALVSGVLTSSDAGQNWERTDLTAPAGSSVYVAGVDPTNADNVYVRFEKLNATSAELSDSWVMYSTDAGQTFQEVLRKKAILFGFTLTPDNSRVLVGFGDPQGPINVEKADLGLWSAPAGTSDFTQDHAAHISCLTFVGNDLYACTSQFQDGFELGVSKDLGKTYEKVMELGHVTPLICPAGTATGDKCAAPWEGHVCNDIGTCALLDGGADGGTPAAPEEKDDETCGCRTVGSERSQAPWLLAVILAAVGARRRKSG